ncbi:MAG: phage tail tape measure protein, partial [Rhizobiaceae bacterium]|nr:phage tail tape measure protein [Rhizobiaceae bacterium]
ATTFFTGLFGGIGGQAAGAAAPLPFAAPAMAAAPSFLDAGSLGGARGMSAAGAPGRDARAPQALMMSADPPSRASIVFNVTTADATSFRKSEAQVTGMLARAVSRGARSL